MNKHMILILLFVILLFSFSTAVQAQSGFNFYDFLGKGSEYLIEYKLENMSLEEKVGQLFQVGFHSKIAAAEIKDLIENYHVGGVIYFERNLDNLEQTAALSKNLQNLALNSGASLPLFIAADQEGGSITRIKGGTHFPGNMALGAAGEAELAKKAAAAAAKELKNIGINFNLAPVLDVNNNSKNPVIGVRSFGGEAKLAAELGTAYITGLQAQEVIAAAKHFPGHGDTAVDSHFDLPVINHSWERLERIELYPFKKAIEAGVDSIMTAHIYFPAIEAESGIPATLSKSVLTGLLRQKFNFTGLIMTDCLEMKAIADNFGTAEAAVRTIEAGSDLVLVSHSYLKQKLAIETVLKAVKNGRISEKRIDKSVKRIIKLKSKRINISEINSFNLKDINFKEHRKIAQEIAEKSITLIKNDDLFPIDNIESKTITVIDFQMNKKPIIKKDEIENIFVNYLKQEIQNLNYFKLTGKSFPKLIKKKEIRESDLIITLIYNGIKNKYQIELAEKLAETNKVFVLALKNPYDYQLINQSQAFMTTYDQSPANQRAAADFILNKISAQGSLPINIE